MMYVMVICCVWVLWRTCGMFVVKYFQMKKKNATDEIIVIYVTLTLTARHALHSYYYCIIIIEIDIQNLFFSSHFFYLKTMSMSIIIIITIVGELEL